MIIHTLVAILAIASGASSRAFAPVPGAFQDSTLGRVREGRDTVAVANTLAHIRDEDMRVIRQALRDGAAAARVRGDSVTMRWYLDQDDLYAVSQRGIVLPRFLREPPPVITAVAGHTLRAYVIGDWGSEEPAHRDVAKAVKRAHRKASFQLGLTVGDNFYPKGINNPFSKRWQSSYEGYYGALGIPLYASLGNHDYLYDGEAAAAEIVYTLRSKTWKMPAEFYTFTAGPVQFFALNTNQLSDYQLRWLSSALSTSTAVWKVVYGHHPLFSGEKTYGLDSATSAQLVSIMKNGGVQVYLAGHHHSLQHTVPVQGIEQFIVGGGGARTYDLNNQDHLPRFAKSTHGFGVIEADPKSFTVRFVDSAGKALYTYTVRR